ncbi:MAG: VOC family protein [Acidimicrobiales bacterium]
MFQSLDFLYTPAIDVDAEVAYLVDVVGATLEWRVRAMATTVACLRVCDDGPRVLLAGHLGGSAPVAVYRVADYAATVAALRAKGVRPRELEIPPGPCAILETPAGQRLGVYQLVRPEAAEHFAGRFDP